ncbi:MAG: hypothetical protein V4511_07635 [Bacteroidota bacterium]
MKNQTSFISIIRVTLLIIVVLLISSHSVNSIVIKKNTEYKHGLETLNGPWENMGNDIRQVCDATYRLEYEWGVTYNNASPIIRVTCNGWNGGFRVCTYPPYPTGDTEPFTWGGICWIWGTASTLDDACSIAFHGYYYQDALGKYYMNSGNGCNSLPTVWRRKL